MQLTLRSAAKLVATLGPVGYIPFASGTWGSGVAVLLWFALLNDQPILLKVIVTFIAIIIAIITAHIAEKSLGRDASPIVIDELAGQWVTYALISTGIAELIAGFFLFRLFDVWKPFPIFRSQRLPGGWGVVIDDVLAGIYASVVLYLLFTVWRGQ